MNLLKNDKSINPRPSSSMIITHWPTERRPEGVGLSVKDGWNLGIGIGLAMFIAVPLILIFLTCVIGLALTFLGSSLGALL